MKNFKQYAMGSLGVVLLGTVIGISLPQTGHSSAASAPPDKDVRVINTTAEAVPVSVQGAVRARQEGTWEVEIGGTPTVAVVNNSSGPLVIRDIDRPTAQPFQAAVDVVLGEGVSGQNGFVTIPAGKLLVIEHVSAFCFAPSDQIMEQFSVLTRLAPAQTNQFHYLNDEKRAFQFANTHTVSETVRLYADAPSMTVRATRLTPTGSVTVRYNVSGYLVDK